MFPASKFGKAVAPTVIILLSMLVGIGLYKVMTIKPPVNTQNAVEPELAPLQTIQTCVNGKRLLVIRGTWPMPANSRSNWDGINGFVWDVDMGGRPIACGQVQEVGPR